MRAVTLLEVMVVVAVVGVVAAVAVPNVAESVARQREIAATARVRHVLLEARDEARLRRGCAKVEGLNQFDPGDGTTQFRQVQVQIDNNCDGVIDEVRPPVDIGAFEFRSMTNPAGGCTPTTHQSVDFDKNGGVLATGGGGVQVFVGGRAFKKFRVLTASGAVREEPPVSSSAPPGGCLL
jgi:prepilin-type N-terminal cleavage/methylation domain-containing protein